MAIPLYNPSAEHSKKQYNTWQMVIFSVRVILQSNDELKFRNNI